jgi:hypothetical protein
VLKALKAALLKSVVEKLTGAFFGSTAVGTIAAAILGGVSSLPLRWQVAGVSSAFALSYFAILRWSHLWMRPVQIAKATVDNTRLRLSIVVDSDLVSVNVFNPGPTQSFAGEVFSVGTAAANQQSFPLPIKWRGTTDEKREIVKGQSRFFDVARIKYQRLPDDQPPADRFTLERFVLLSSNQELEIMPQWYAPGRITEHMTVDLNLTATDTGLVTCYEVIISAATDGSHFPLLRASIVTL